MHQITTMLSKILNINVAQKWQEISLDLEDAVKARQRNYTINWCFKQLQPQDTNMANWNMCYNVHFSWANGHRQTWQTTSSEVGGNISKVMHLAYYRVFWIGMLYIQFGEFLKRMDSQVLCMNCFFKFQKWWTEVVINV